MPSKHQLMLGPTVPCRLPHVQGCRQSTRKRAPRCRSAMFVSLSWTTGTYRRLLGPAGRPQALSAQHRQQVRQQAWPWGTAHLQDWSKLPGLAASSNRSGGVARPCGASRLHG